MGGETRNKNWPRLPSQRLRPPAVEKKLPTDYCGIDLGASDARRIDEDGYSNGLDGGLVIDTIVPTPVVFFND